MPGLKYDTEAMRTTAKNYRTIGTTMGSLQITLKQQITDLKDVYWKSDAGTTFQNMYQEGWSNTVDKYIIVLNEMADQLDKAADEYDKITDKLKEIEGVSI